MSRSGELQFEKPLCVAILALGGQGGGVLSDWIVTVAESNGWQAQSTSVPGVAQRTGATLYYIEMMRAQPDNSPVFSLMPAPGDVDVVIAAEHMEAGRAILRGLVTPEKTTVIASTHRAYAISEKELAGDGIGEPESVDAALQIAAKKVIVFDMEEMARQHGTVISAPLLGALAGSGTLPFSRQSFEDAIGAGSETARASRQGFEAGFARSMLDAPRIQMPPDTSLPESLGAPALDHLLERVRTLPVTAQAIALEGLKRAIDFQDIEYGREYLERIETLKQHDERAGGRNKNYAFTELSAKYLATALAYDDVIGVADLKTRSERYARIARDMGAKWEEPLYITEFMHPRAEEIVGLLPTGLGEWLSARPKLMRIVERLFSRPRHVKTATIGGFLQLYCVARLRPFRRKLLRHKREMQHIQTWLDLALSQLDRNYDLGCGIIKARRLIKGYSDTHSRGLSKYDRVISAVAMLEHRDDAGSWMDRLTASALKDEDGVHLDGALKTLQSL